MGMILNPESHPVSVEVHLGVVDERLALDVPGLERVGVIGTRTG